MTQNALLQPDYTGHIVVINCGGQTAHLIASELKHRVGVRTAIVSANTLPAEIRKSAGIIISGSPSSVYEAGSPQPDAGLLDMNVPVLGICYGMHIMAKLSGGDVRRGKNGEFGRAKLHVKTSPTNHLLQAGDDDSIVWMSHGDHVTLLPPKFVTTATSPDCSIAAFAHQTKPLFGVQFHPEVRDTKNGREILGRFAYICDASRYSLESYREDLLAQIKADVGESNVLMLLSGGVDSTVAFKLLTEALGRNRVQGLLIDTGLLRFSEAEQILRTYREIGLENIGVFDAEEIFMNALVHTDDPQEKREAIGEAFVRAYRQYAVVCRRTIDDNWLLGQGTLYPDWIESGTAEHSHKIKLHHNMHREVAAMRERGLVIEPLRELYKNDVRELGKLLGLPETLIWREPFPGPGLAVRTLCCREPERFSRLRSIWRRLTWRPIFTDHVILPVKSIGVQGDQRSYAHAVAIFIGRQNIYQLDFYATDIAPLITNQVRQINRVLVCLSHDHPVQFHSSHQMITRERIELAREADRIVREATKEVRGIWQFPVVLLPCGTKIGQQGIVLRPVVSVNAMTATPYILKSSIVTSITEQLLTLPGIDCVFYDITNKPPGTIEWE